MRRFSILLIPIVLCLIANGLYAQRNVSDEVASQPQTVRQQVTIEEEEKEESVIQIQAPIPQRRASQEDGTIQPQTPQSQQRVSQGDRVTQPQVSQPQQWLNQEDRVSMPTTRPEQRPAHEEVSVPSQPIIRRDRRVETIDPTNPILDSRLSNGLEMSEPSFYDNSHRQILNDALRFRSLTASYHQIMQLTARANLNAAQSRVIDALAFEFQRDIEEKEEIMKKLLVDQGMAMIENNFHKASRFALEIHSLKSELTILTINLFESIYSVLTPEQRVEITKQMYEFENSAFYLM